MTEGTFYFVEEFLYETHGDENILLDEKVIRIYELKKDNLRYKESVKIDFKKNSLHFVTKHLKSQGIQVEDVIISPL